MSADIHPDDADFAQWAPETSGEYETRYVPDDEHPVGCWCGSCTRSYGEPDTDEHVVGCLCRDCDGNGNLRTGGSSPMGLEHATVAIAVGLKTSTAVADVLAAAQKRATKRNRG